MHRTVRQYQPLLAELAATGREAVPAATTGRDAGLAGSTTDAFEASVMYLCTAARRQPGRRPGSVGSPWAPFPHGEPNGGGAAGTGVVADFDSAAAAVRFRDAVARCLRERAWVEPVVSGIRYNFEVYRVGVAPHRRAYAIDLLATAWRDSLATINDRQPLSRSSVRWRRRQELAVAAWRAMLLASPPVRTSRALRVRLPSVELATVAVRSARLLGVDTQMRHGQGVCVVSVEEQAAAYRLLAQVTAREPAATGAA